MHRNPYESHDAYDAIRTQDADLAVSTSVFMSTVQSKRSHKPQTRLSLLTETISSNFNEETASGEPDTNDVLMSMANDAS